MIEQVDNDMPEADDAAGENGFEVAIIGMACRFPGAENVDQYWQNLCEGVESISFFTDDEVLASGMDPSWLRHPDFVPALGSLEGTEMFDAAFFRYSPREADTMAPQHRLMLECAYQALQHAGYDAQRYDGAIGVFVGESSSSYTRPGQFENSSNKDVFNSAHARMGNDREFLSTTVSYKLGLTGPSLTIQTACSTSLATAHMAYQSLLGGESDIALAGGIALRMPPKTGYFYQKEGIMSPDGHCRAFDAAAQGTVGGEGVGVVTLKRLEDALADGDCIHAVIKGSALNNDGSVKVGYTAPGVEGQADVIARAQAMAEVGPDTIGYIETHGTGTLLGDPIEIAALTRAFRARGAERDQYCAIGSVKTNIGHLDTAAGVAGLIKTALVLEHRQIPASLHFEQANPQIDFASSPFYVSQSLTDWQSDHPFRAGVSSFGMGGSNVHMVLEEPPRQRSEGRHPRAAKLLMLSAITETALDRSCADLAAHLRANPELSLTDVAYTLQAGRQQFRQRRCMLCGDLEDAVELLETRDPKRVSNGVSGDETPSVVFMFPGQGSQYLEMGRELYAQEAVFREHFDACCDGFETEIGVNLRDLIFGPHQDPGQARERLEQTSLTQPALFAVEYSLARLWMSWGVRPQAMIGHSIGEYAAACLSGVLSFTDALGLVAARAALMQSMDAGSMTAVNLPAEELEKRLGEGLSIAAINEQGTCVVSGETQMLAELEADLENQGRECRRLHTSHAFHSAMMDGVIEPFEERLRAIEIGRPEIPYVSNLTGGWVSAQQLADPAYWSGHLRNTVRFAEGLESLFENPASLFLEVGPGQTLTGLVRGNPSRQAGQRVVASMRHPKNPQSDGRLLLTALGQLWTGGVEIDWNGFYRYQSPRRVPLPGYPFERHRHWIEPANDLAANRPSTERKPLRNWFYVPGWKSSTMARAGTGAQPGDGCWLVFSDGGEMCRQLVDLLRARGRDVSTVFAGNEFECLENADFAVSPGNRTDMSALLAHLKDADRLPRHIAHLWAAAGDAAADLDEALARGFYSLLHLAQCLAEYPSAGRVELAVVGRGTRLVTGNETLCPENAVATGLCQVIPQELDGVHCRAIDIDAAGEGGAAQQTASLLVEELERGATDSVVALRNGRRWTAIFEPLCLDEAPQPQPRLRERGVYLITGGFGNIGLHLARYLATSVGARLVLIGRSELPARDDWDAELAARGEDSETGRRILALRALEQAGAEVLALSADVTDETGMRAVIEQVVDRFGKIDGVIHAAATNDPRSFQLLGDMNRECCELQFGSKIRGLQVLDRVLQGQQPDFCVLMSSLASLLGGLRFAAYASANAYLDAFAQHRQALPWCSVNWDGWQFGGAAADHSAVARRAMSPEEGVTAFARLLELSAVPQIAVSTWDLQARRDQWAMQQSAAAAGDGGGSRAADSTRETGGLDQAPEQTPDPQSPPEIESFLCRMWQDLLGVEGVTAQDNFFELGGDSLLALQVTSRLRQSLLGDISVATVLESANIAALARRVAEQHLATDEADDNGDMLQRLKQLSPQERQRYLAEARKEQGSGK